MGRWVFGVERVRAHLCHSPHLTSVRDYRRNNKFTKRIAAVKEPFDFAKVCVHGEKGLLGFDFAGVWTYGDQGRLGFDFAKVRRTRKEAGFFAILACRLAVLLAVDDAHLQLLLELALLCCRCWRCRCWRCRCWIFTPCLFIVHGGLLLLDPRFILFSLFDHFFDLVAPLL